MEEVRKNHSRAYERWSGDEELRLMELHREELSVEWIAAALQRQPLAIRSRLRRLLGDGIE